MTEQQHFGQLLRRLREQRGASQAQLAELAHVSEFTIRRGEGSETSPWKRSTARDVYQALCAVAPLSKADAREFLTAVGLQGIIDVARTAEGMPGVRSAHHFAKYLLDLPDSAARDAMLLADLMVEELGGQRMHDILTGVLAAEGLHVETGDSGKSLVYHGASHRAENHEVHEPEPARRKSP